MLRDRRLGGGLAGPGSQGLAAGTVSGSPGLGLGCAGLEPRWELLVTALGRGGRGGRGAGQSPGPAGPHH